MLEIIGWPWQGNAFILFAVLLLAGVLVGAVVSKTRHVPRISGFIFAGVLLGPSVSGVLDHELLRNAQLFVDIALGLILYRLGLLLDFRQTWHVWQVRYGAVGEAVLTLLAVSGLLYWFGLGWLESLLAGAIAISSSPAVLLMVAGELGAKGPVTERALSLVALNNALSFILFATFLPLLHANQDASWAVIIGQPLYSLCGSLLLGGVLAWLQSLLLRFCARENEFFALMIAIIMLGLGVAKALHLSPLMALLACGAISRNLPAGERFGDVDFGRSAELFFILLFVIAGANLHLAELAHYWLAAVLFVLARSVAKLSSSALIARLSGLDGRQGLGLGLSLTPMAGLAIGLVQSSSQLYPGFSATLSAIVLGAIAILETVGPLATEFGLKHAREVDGSIEH